MGRIRDLIAKIANKAIENSSLDTLASKEIFSDPLSASEVVSPILFWEMPHGIPRTEQEILEENKMLLSTLDPKIDFLLELIAELNEPEVLPHDIFASERSVMKLWTAHIAFKDRIDTFYNFITNKTNNLLDPSVLGKKETKKTSNIKRIKCITDLPLQKKILN